MVDTQTFALHAMEAMEARTHALCTIAQSRRRRAACGANGWQFSRPVAPRGLPGAQYRTARRLLRIARTPPTEADGEGLTNRTAVYGPARTVVWEGRSGDAPPIPIVSCPRP
jgi:hypothetical protein